MQLVAEYTVKARPDRRVLEVYDADAYLSDEQALIASRSQVVAGNGYHLYLRSLQDVLDATINIRIWSGPARPPGDVEGTTPVTLESETGTLVIAAFTAGPVGEMTLPRPGVYTGHASWRGRQAAEVSYQTTLNSLTDDASDEDIAAAWARTPATEEAYVLDLHYLRAVDDEDDD
ncbi:hypothetical protein [Streptomyces beihaiensis]|uniref:Uncharacterized protein n=1 Tax=Streptomyces beihaiensis TaxID=2984495 RepID=A0ABT3TVT0_9ACTN|nr:hypothetical protein [Streptomyces beihaiensis]MCX3061163.1 hypothetical protein [Streptomyces beihaiensis]